MYPPESTAQSIHTDVKQWNHEDHEGTRRSGGRVFRRASDVGLLEARSNTNSHAKALSRKEFPDRGDFISGTILYGPSDGGELLEVNIRWTTDNGNHPIVRASGGVVNAPSLELG